MPGLRIAVQGPRHLPDSFRQPRGRPGNYGKQFTGGHSDQGEEVFRRLFFRFSLRRQFSEVLHHGIGIDLADGADLVLEFELFLMFVLVLMFLFHLFFPEQAADHIADSAEPAFAFAGFMLHLFFHLLLELVLMLEFVKAF
jgi:hypothetical protein